ncbi:hypothetical protein [Micrococcus yunnanensis]|uniref:hypothetical protein n=1 Tax=Micrococcus yunnanensis TaxID=566027 RepID=UPI0017897F6D|nr:hypothetical protein [Micrococcus yunnanensis]MBE1538345.1 hypothetical protein [Micrococcus yunnanensis]
MRRIVGDPWFYPVLFVAGGLTFMIAGTRLQQVGMIVAGLVLAGYAVTYRWAVRVRSRPFAGAQAHVEGGGVVVFWRPGCQYCMTLLKALTPEERGRVHWVNIWQEPEAAAALEALHARRDGHAHQAVPTAWTRRRDYVVATDATRARLKDTLRQHAGGDA